MQLGQPLVIVRRGAQAMYGNIITLSTAFQTRP